MNSKLSKTMQLAMDFLRKLVSKFSEEIQTELWKPHIDIALIIQKMNLKLMSPYNILDRLVSQWLPSLTQVLLQERCWCQTCCSLFENKLSHFINTKDKIPFFNKPSVIFEFSCPWCRAKYISKLTVHYEITSKRVYNIPTLADVPLF